jgi:hypothetical protein
MLAMEVKLRAVTRMIAYLCQAPCISGFHLGLDVDGTHSGIRGVGLALAGLMR